MIIIMASVKKVVFLQHMKINIYIDNNYIMLSNLSKETKALFTECFTFNDASKAFDVSGKFDGKRIIKVKLYTIKEDKILLYSGFLKEVFKLVKSKKLPVNVVDNRKKVKEVKEDLRSFFPKEFTYTEHQEDALGAMLKTSCGIIKAPTSSGKSSVIIAYLKATNLPAIILVNKVDLANQLYKNLEDAGLNVGICTGKKMSEGKIIISTIFSVKKIPNIHSFPLVIIDEVHHASSSVYQNLFKEVSFDFRFGFSATPKVGDVYKWALTKQFVGSIIYEVDAKSLMDKRVLARPTIHFLNHDCKPTLDWESGYQLNIIYNDERNNMIKNLVDEKNLSTLVIVRYIDHGKALKEILPEAVFLSGDTPIEDRQQAILDFEDKKIKIIIATSIFNEGISINAIQLLVIASGGKSNVEVAQRLGRSLRIDSKRDKYTVDVYDFLDKGNRFTERHANQRISIYKSSGFKVLLPNF